MLHRLSKRFAFVLSLALALFSSLAAAQSASPSGSFGLLLNGWQNDPNDSGGAAILGVLNLDGAGNLGGTYTFVNAKLTGQAPQTASGSVTGTYTMNPSGAGTVNLNFDIGIGLTFAAVVTDGGQGIQLVSTKGSGAANNLGGG